ncbi:leucocin A/sakacin P family class II bacteriocin [Streptococcus dysgalactiae]|uniref:leucocin A/sakacin P family class II bacteriocin n=1 Tax=Streptococcus dysgalactiae TaxID=1334 RepID=UPI000E02EAC3|nr:leucocin A/sakacin P family class II bacteriocin [Streptococcus dysgalactiae]QQC49087.1 leucocin A/sakacin P family class II bacteriocin [Streptococcus dysgalactiae]SUN66076.1 bacteriocin ubericin-A [Streptococcus dysgalactiae subsp. equisimilis]
MNTKIFEKFDFMDNEKHAYIDGGAGSGKTVYQGNGLYCNKVKCWVNWAETWTTIANNSVMNVLTGGNAGWHSGGAL